MRLDRLMTKTTGVLLLLKLQNESLESADELRISHMDSKVLHATESSFVSLLIDMVDTYMNNPS